MKAWLFQDTRQKQNLGDKCPWSVGWIDPDGRRRSKRIGPKSLAQKYARKLEGQLAAGGYQGESRKQWADFRDEYEATIAGRVAPNTRREILNALNHFERLIKPKRLTAVQTKAIDEYVERRRKERGKKRESTVSPATVNKELRHIKAVLHIANDWGYLPRMPKVRMVKEPVKLIRYVTPEHFAAIYRACDVAVRPQSQAYQSAEWWRALITFAYMTGWRVSEPLALQWDDGPSDRAPPLTRNEDNKRNRDERVPLHPVVVDHLRTIIDFGPLVFYWPHHERTLWTDFAKIQESAGIALPCREKHEHTPACHVYGFHDLRRAFATVNAPKLSADALQALMRHKSYTTTQRYVNMAKQLDQAVETLHVPEVLRKAN